MNVIKQFINLHRDNNIKTKQFCLCASKGKHIHMGDKPQTSLEDGDMPRFAEPVSNVTVSVGRDALLACVVENLKGYKVAWVRVDTQTILSIHHNVISQNNRISLTYNDHRSWYLHIKEVEESDRGWYMCQVNTDPMRSRKGYLQVVVPPMIVEGMTSNDLVVREGLNVTLMCKARGYPEPYVMWRREDGEEMLIGGEHVNVVDGELLHITKVSRLHMAAYLCVASNGVPPSISKRVHLRVQFPPMLSIPNQLEGAYIGQDVVLECHTEAYPASINYWTTERGDMIISDTSRAGDKYETTSTVNGYTKYMKLKIRNVGPNDFGTYRCVAKNSLGETDGNIKLDEMPAPTTAILSEMAMLNRSLGTMYSRKSNTGDNNQAPMRNPPDAFHNSAAGLAQNNLVGVIIQAIKMQSLRIFERLTNLRRTINVCDTTVCPTSASNIRNKITELIRKARQKYVHKIQKLITMLAMSLRKMIKSTVFILRKQKEEQQQQQHYQHYCQPQYKNLITEAELKTFKHVCRQESPYTNNHRHRHRHNHSYNNFKQNNNKMGHRTLRTTRLCCYLTDKTFMILKKPQQQLQQQQHSHNFNFIDPTTHVADFQNHIKQQEILHKFNTIYFKNNNNNNNNHLICNSFSNIKQNLNFVSNTIYWWVTILLLTVTSVLIIMKRLLSSKAVIKHLRHLTSTCKNFLSHQLLLLLLLHIVCAMNFVLKILINFFSKINFYIQYTALIPKNTTITTTQRATFTSATLSSCSILIFCR